MLPTLLVTALAIGQTTPLAWPSAPAPTETLDVLTTLPDRFRRPGGISEHSINQKHGRPLDSFLEGPLVIGDDLFVTDIPYDRIFKIDLNSKNWTLVAEYDGEPNGLAWHAQRQQIVIADFKQGILGLDPDTGNVPTIFARWNGERLRGPNDLAVGSDGTIYFTDQGMTGLQDPTGRVFRLHADGRVDLLIDNGPSPNGIVLNKAEDSIFVAMTRDRAIWNIPIYPDGSAQRTGRFSSYYGTGGPDGLLLDDEKNLFVAHSSLTAVFIHSSNGEPLKKLSSDVGSGITNLAWRGNGSNEVLIVESASGSILTTKWEHGGLSDWSRCVVYWKGSFSCGHAEKCILPPSGCG